MINPVNAMKVFNERKTFIQNHPEFFDFVVGKFGEELPIDTVIELKVVTPGRRGMECVCKAVRNGSEDFGGAEKFDTVRIR